MAESEILPSSRRRAAHDVRRARYRRLVGFAAAAVLVIGAVVTALTLAGVVDLEKSGAKNHAAPVRTHEPSGSSSTTAPPEPNRHRALTPDDPLRLWIAGDSLAGSIGPSLGQLTANTGVVQPQYDSRVSSGLLNPNFFDWPEHAAEELDDLDPEVVVFLIGTNDANVWDKSKADEYRLRTELMMTLLAGDDEREVLWVGPPVAKASDLEEGVLAVAAIQRETAKKVPGVTYVDAHQLFDDDDGEYQYRFAGLDGETDVMRAGDGVHFSVDGADYLGQVLYALLDPRWRLTEQAVPGRATSVRETEGSTQVAGTHRSITSQPDESTATTRPGTAGSSSTSSSTTATSTTTVPSTTTTTTTTTTPPTSPGP